MNIPMNSTAFQSSFVRKDKEIIIDIPLCTLNKIIPKYSFLPFESRNKELNKNLDENGTADDNNSDFIADICTTLELGVKAAECIVNTKNRVKNLENNFNSLKWPEAIKKRKSLLQTSTLESATMENSVFKTQSSKPDNLKENGTKFQNCFSKTNISEVLPPNTHENATKNSPVIQNFETDHQSSLTNKLFSPEKVKSISTDIDKEVPIRLSNLETECQTQTSESSSSTKATSKPANIKHKIKKKKSEAQSKNEKKQGNSKSDRSKANDPNLYCEICNKFFKSKLGFKLHKAAHETKLRENPEIDGKKANIPESTTCCECGKIFKYRRGLLEHRSIHDAHLKFSCDVCGKLFRTKRNVKDHKKTHNVLMKDFKCTMCFKAFSCGKNLRRHFRYYPDHNTEIKD